MKKKMLSACSIGMMLFVLTACGTKTQSVEQAKAGEESVTEQTESTVQEFVKKEEADVLGSYEEQYGEQDFAQWYFSERNLQILHKK